MRPASSRLAAILACSLISGLAWLPVAQAQAGRDNQVLYELMSRLGQLEREIRQLRGDLELYRHLQEQEVQRQKERHQALDRRLQALEERLSEDAASVDGAPGEPGDSTVGLVSPTDTASPSLDEEAPAAATPPAAATATPTPDQPLVPAPPAPGAEQAAYDAAFGMLREGDYEQAIARFQEFLTTYPDSRLAGNAQYWLGEAYYVTRDFPKAREVLANLGEKYPASDKLPDALLKLGYIHDELGEKAKARQVLQQVLQAYPDSQAAGLAERRLQTMQ
jgi:tol-pal system protein YbgF